METYANHSGRSTIVRYQIGQDYIVLEYTPSDTTHDIFYRYTYHVPGHLVVEDMKKLAESGDGLDDYIDRHKVLPTHTGARLTLI